MGNVASKKLPYDPEKFVDREAELELVLDKVRRIHAGSPVERRVVIFHGQRGSGKTWLLRELEHRTQSPEYAATPYFVALAHNADPDSIEEEVPAERPLLVMVDEIQEASSQALDVLQAQVLSPLLNDSRVILVLAERGRPYYWTEPRIREDSDELDLIPFERPYVEQQVEVQATKEDVDIDEIIKLGGGFPWSNYILAENLPDRTILDVCVDLFLQDVDSDLHSHFETLSILRAFDEIRMGRLLEAAAGDGQLWDRRSCVLVRQQMVKTTLICWQAEQRGYVIDEPLRRVLEARLMDRDPERWVHLHCVAYRLYETWAIEYDQSRDWWEKEKEYHRECLEQVGRDPADCPGGEGEGENGA